MQLKSYERSNADELRRRVHLLDGVTRYSLSLWKLPEGVAFDDVDLATWPQEYLQAAGRQDRFTVEERRIAQGDVHHFVVGHLKRSAESPVPEETIVWNGCETVVGAGEVFALDEVADLFVSYYLHGRLTAGHSLRRIEL